MWHNRKNSSRLARFGLQNQGMAQLPTPKETLSGKPICIGLTCWRWESKRPQAIIRLAQRLGVTLELTQKINGLHREIEAQVSGQNVDRFLGEFARHC